MKVKSVFITSVGFFCGILCLSCQKINPDELTGDYVYAEIDGTQYKSRELSHERSRLYIHREYKSAIGGEDYVAYLSSDIVLYQQQNTFFGTKRFCICFCIGVLLQDESYPLVDHYKKVGIGPRRIQELGEDFLVFYEAPFYSHPNVGIESAWVKIDRLDTVNHRAYGQFEINCTKKGKSVIVKNGKFDISYHEETQHYISK